MRIYISGPMTSRPKLNFPAFMHAEMELHSLGHDVVSPARLSLDVWLESGLIDVIEADYWSSIPDNFWTEIDAILSKVTAEVAIFAELIALSAILVVVTALSAI